MDSKDSSDGKVEVNFESHPPIEEDRHGISSLLRQALLHFTDCNALASYLIGLKDVTQVIAVEGPDEENTSDEDEPDNDIYAVFSVIDLQATSASVDESQAEAIIGLRKFILDNCPKFNDFLSSDSKSSEPVKLAMIVNERYINLPAQLALPALKNLTQHLTDSKFTHFTFVTKILIKSKQKSENLPSKKRRSGESSGQASDPFVYVNPEEEVVFECSKYHSDLDVSSHCDENAAWSFGSDFKYIPHRRILVLEAKEWPKLLNDIEKELNS